MAINLIQERLRDYSPQSPEEELDAVKEIIQEIILYGLSITHFFNEASFQGGTALRILHGLPRFSEDLELARWRVFLVLSRRIFSGFDAKGNKGLTI